MAKRGKPTTTGGKAAETAASGPAPGAAPAPDPRFRLRLPAVLGLGALSTLLFYLAFHPVALWPLAYVCLVPWLIGVEGSGLRRAVVASGLIHMAQGFAANYWLSILGWDTLIGTALGYFLYGLAFGAFLKTMLSSRRVPVVLWFPISIAALEFIQGTLFFFAYPWSWLGQSQVAFLPIVQVADLGGATVVSFVVAAANAAVFEAVALARAWRPLPAGASPFRAIAWRAASAFALFAAATGYGMWRLTTLPTVEGPRILVVQGNIPQERKNEGERTDDLFLTYRDLTLRARGQPVDLVLWPETMLPLWPVQLGPGKYEWVPIDRHAKLRERMGDLARTLGAPIVAGSPHWERTPAGERHHNSAFFIAEDARIVHRYDKIYLAPVSEFAPFEESWPWAHRQIRSLVPPGFVQFERGKQVDVIDLPTREGRTWRIAPSICFDITFARHTVDAARAGAEVVVNVSNYGWFKDSAELDLALDHTVLRAIETRRGVVTCVNGGISAFVDPLGRTRQLEVGGRRKQVEGLLVDRAVTSTVTSPYVRFGDAWAYACIALSAALLAGSVASGRRRARNTGT